MSLYPIIVVGVLALVSLAALVGALAAARDNDAAAEDRSPPWDAPRCPWCGGRRPPR